MKPPQVSKYEDELQAYRKELTRVGPGSPGYNNILAKMQATQNKLDEYLRSYTPTAMDRQWTPAQEIVPQIPQVNPGIDATPIIPDQIPGDGYDPNNPTLPENPTYEQLARYEQDVRNLQGAKYKKQIGDLKTGIQAEYDKSLDKYQGTTAARRKTLSTSLADTARKNFQMNNPYILEDLNSRGVFTSETAVNQAQANALKELELANAGTLNEFDASSRSYEDSLAAQRLKDLNELDAAGTQSEMQANQDALDAALDLRRGQLEAGLNSANSAREEQLARDLAKQQERAQLTNSLLGLGGNLGSIYLGSKLLGGGSTAAATGAGASSLFGGGSLIGTGAGTTGAASSLFPGGLGTVGTAAPAAGGMGGLLGVGAIGAAGLGASALSKAVEAAAKKKAGSTIGNVAGFIANPIGSQINKAKEFIKDPKKTISKVFCFEANTPIAMDDDSQRPICQLYIGAETKGGIVESIRTAKTEAGSRYLYKGIQVTGMHAVKENGKWIRVKDSDHSSLLKGGGIVWSIVTDKHRVWINGIEFADEYETDQHEFLTIDQSLNHLNLETAPEVLAYGV